MLLTRLVLKSRLVENNSSFFFCMLSSFGPFFVLAFLVLTSSKKCLEGKRQQEVKTATIYFARSNPTILWGACIVVVLLLHFGSPSSVLSRAYLTMCAGACGFIW